MNLKTALAELSRKLQTAGVGMNDLEARYLLCEAANITQIQLVTDGEHALSANGELRLGRMLQRRLKGEPLARVLGHAEFWGLSIIVTPAVLDPRGDSETLIAAAIEIFADRKAEPLRILDLGTGSGALLCALLSEFGNATGVGVDVSEGAAKVARKNLAQNGHSERGCILVSNWADSLNGSFDLIVSNPPYIETDVISGLDVSVREFDPILALDGGKDGYDCYRSIISALPRLLKPGGWSILEAGALQAEGISSLFGSHGSQPVLRFKDYGGHDRVIAARFG